MSLLGYALHPRGECIHSRGYGDAGISTGPLTPVLGWGLDTAILTMPAMFGRVLLFTSPQIGSVGYTPLTEQSDRLTPSGVIAREILDYPSYVKFFKPLFYLLKHEGRRAVTSLDVEILLEWEIGGEVAVVVSHDSERGERYVKRALSIMGSGGSPPWVSDLSVPRLIRRPSDGLKGALLDLGRNISLERTLASLGSLDIYPPGEVPPPDYDYLVVSSGPGDPVDSKVLDSVGGALERWLGVRPVVGVGHGALAIFSLLGVELVPEKPKGVVEVLKISGGGVRGESVILHTYRPLADGWEVCMKGEGALGVHNLAWVNHDRGVGCVITEDRGEGVLQLLRSLEVVE